MKKLCVISLVLLIFTACSQYVPSVASLTASIVSSYDNPVVIRVFMEGNDGNYITGARVHITNPGGQLESAGFTTNEGCYKGYFEELLSGEYTITVYSALLPQQTKLQIPCLTESSITQFLIRCNNLLEAPKRIRVSCTRDR